MKTLTNKFLLLAALLVAFAIVPATTYGQSKQDDTKNVNVVNTPTVTVTNTPKVLNANDLNIFQETRLLNTWNDDQNVFTYIVPEKKRLVVEFVSVRASIGKGETIEGFIRGGNGFSEAIHPITMTYQSTVAGRDSFVSGNPMKLYAEPGTTVVILVSRRDAADTGVVKADANVQTSISGYLVDVP